MIFGDGKQTRDFLYVKDIANLIAVYVKKKALGNFTIKRSAAIQREVRYIFLDIAKAKKELGWIPTPFKKGVKETIAWFKENVQAF